MQSRISALKYKVFFLTTALMTICCTVQAAQITANVTARYGSGNTTLAEDSVSGLALGNNDSSGIYSVNNGSLAAAGVSQSALAGNAIGVASAWSGTSILNNPNAGPIWNTFATGRIDFDDTLLVQSAILAPGTPVQVDFTLHLSQAINFGHDVFEGGENNRARVSASLAGSVTTVGGPGDSFFISSSNNRSLFDTAGPQFAIQSGIFDPNTPVLNFTVNSRVGDELRLFLRLTADSAGGVAPTEDAPGQGLVNRSGFANAALGLAFGATAQLPNVTINSELYGGALPLASAATQNAALGAQPPAPVPIPPAIVLMASALLALGARLRSS